METKCQKCPNSRRVRVKEREREREREAEAASLPEPKLIRLVETIFELKI
jgi:hypothetical protein